MGRFYADFGIGRYPVHVILSPHLDIKLIGPRLVVYRAFDGTTGKERQQRADENKHGEATHRMIVHEARRRPKPS